MDCFNQTLAQVGIWVLVQQMITKMADKMAATYKFACCGHSNVVFFNRIFSKFHIRWIASIKLSLKWNIGFVRPTITKMADKMAIAYQFALVDTPLSFITQMLPDFIYGFLLSNSHPRSNMVLSDNQDGHLYGHHLSVCRCGHSNLVIYHLIPFKFHILTLAQVGIWDFFR